MTESASDSAADYDRLLIVTLHGRHTPATLSEVMSVLEGDEHARLRDISSFTVQDRFTMTLAVGLSRATVPAATAAATTTTTANADAGGAASLSSSSPPAPSTAAAHDQVVGRIMKEMLLKAHDLGGVEVDFEVIEANGGNRGCGKSGDVLLSTPVRGGHCQDEQQPPEHLSYYTFTFLGTPRIPAAFFAAATQLLAENDINISAVRRLSEPGGRVTCFVVSAYVAVPIGAKVRAQLLHLGKEHLVDTAFERDGSLRIKRLVVFDLSWTLVQSDAFDLVCAAAGVDTERLTRARGGRCRRRRRSGADGQVEQGDASGQDASEGAARVDEEKKAKEQEEEEEHRSNEHLRARARLLQGRSAEETRARARQSVQYTEGAHRVCRTLKRLGYKLAVISSGPSVVAEIVKADLGLDFAVGNALVVDADGNFTGELLEPLVNGNRKRDLVAMLSMQERLDAEQIIAVGDGPVSAGMLEAAGLSIAFEQPGSRAAADTDGKIQGKSLESILFLLGIGERDAKHISVGVV